MTMNKSQVIKLKCLDCAGDSPKEVTLCHVVDCPLWPFRFGYSMRDKRFNRRMEAAKKNYPKDYQEMLTILSEHLKSTPNSPRNAQIHALLERKT